MFSLLVSFVSKLVFLLLRTQSAGSFPPPLGKEEEKELFRRMRAGDKDARCKLIEHNLRLVAHIVKKYYSTCKDQEDLISVGSVGLIKAIDSYDPENGTRFATYAGKCLQNEILMYFRAQKKTLFESSLNDPVDTDKDGNPLTYMDILCSDEDITETIDLKMKSSLIKSAMRDALCGRERRIVALRYGMTDDGKCLTQREAARQLGISRSYVSRIEKTALEKIRDYIVSHGA